MSADRGAKLFRSFTSVPRRNMTVRSQAPISPEPDFNLFSCCRRCSDRRNQLTSLKAPDASNSQGRSAPEFCLPNRPSARCACQPPSQSGSGSRRPRSGIRVGFLGRGQLGLQLVNSHKHMMFSRYEGPTGSPYDRSSVAHSVNRRGPITRPAFIARTDGVTATGLPVRELAGTRDVSSPLVLVRVWRAPIGDLAPVNDPTGFVPYVTYH